MGASISISLTGADDLKKRLDALTEKLRDSALRSAAYAGAKIIQDQAIENAPLFTGKVSEGHPPPGTLKNSIIVKRLDKECGDFKVSYIITVRRGDAGSNTDAFYAHWVEFGHIYRSEGEALTGSKSAKAAKRSMHVTLGGKVVPANPFMRTAFASKRDEALHTIEERLSQYITNAGA